MSEYKKVAILMGSKSDLDIMKPCTDALKEFGIEFEINVLSAHRAPKHVANYVESAFERNIGVFVCGAGGAAHLAGMVAGHTTLPVIGIPVGNGKINGLDSLLATVQMPKGIPVATVAVDGSYNAGLLAVQMLAIQCDDLKQKLVQYKKNMEEKVLKTSKEVQDNFQ